MQSGSTCKDTIVKNSYLVVNGMNGDVSISEGSICRGETVRASSNLYINYPIDQTNQVAYQWKTSPEEGAIIDSPNAKTTKITFNKAGCFGVTLVMTNSVGCKLELSVPGGVCVGSIPNYEIDSTFCINYPYSLPAFQA